MADDTKKPPEGIPDKPIVETRVRTPGETPLGGGNRAGGVTQTILPSPSVGRSRRKGGFGGGGATGGWGKGATGPGSAAGYPVSNATVEAYIRQAARERGIDPNVAVRIYRNEGAGGWQSKVPRSGRGSYNGREDSWGPFQLYMGGGLGNQAPFNVRDPNTWRENIEFALDNAARGGWGPWYGRIPAGVGKWEGLNGARPVGINVDPVPGVQNGQLPISTLPATGASLFQPVDGNLHRTEAGMDPELRARLLAMKMASPYGGANLMGPRSGYRSYQEQVDIANAARRKHGANWRKWAAMPGNSNHGFGQAADLTYGNDAEQKWYHQNAKFYGIHFRMGHEPWHAEKDPLYEGRDFYRPDTGVGMRNASEDDSAKAGIGDRSDVTIPYRGKPHSLILPTTATPMKGRSTVMAFPSDQHNSRNSLRRVTVYEIDDTGTQQTVWMKGLYDEEIKMGYRAQGHGLSTVPPVGSEGMAFSLAGRPDQIFFLESEHKDHRPVDQKPGDAVLYDAFGNTIKMEEGAITHTHDKHVINGDITINGNVTINGDIDQDGAIDSTGVHKAAGHV